MEKNINGVISFYYRAKPIVVSPFAAQMFYRQPTLKGFIKSNPQNFYYRRAQA